MKAIVALLLLFVPPANAESDATLWSSPGSRVVAIPALQVPPSIIIGNLVTIKPDGTIEFGEGYEPDAAARAFWAAIGNARCGEVPK